MNKIKLYIVPQHQVHPIQQQYHHQQQQQPLQQHPQQISANYDNKLLIKNDKKLLKKKYNSEKNLLYTNLYNNSNNNLDNLIINNNSNNNNQLQQITTPPRNCLIKSNSFLTGTLIKKCKSVRELFYTKEQQQQQQHQHDNNNYQQNIRTNCKQQAQQKPPKHHQLQQQTLNGTIKIVNDDANKLQQQQRCSVKELRKNYENYINNTKMNININNEKVIERGRSFIRTKTIYKKCEFSVNEYDKNILLKKRNKSIERDTGISLDVIIEKDNFNIIRERSSIDFTNTNGGRPFYLHETKSGTIKTNTNTTDKDLENKKISKRRPPIPCSIIQKNNKTAPLMENDLEQLKEKQLHDDHTKKPATATASSILSCGNTLLKNSFYLNQRSSCSKLEELFNCYDVTINDLINNQKNKQRPTKEFYLNQNSKGETLLNKNKNCTLLKKASSVNKIDIDALKYELDDFVDPEWQANRQYLRDIQHQRFQSPSRLFGRQRKELDLEQKIDLEIKMREGSAKLLAACNNPKLSTTKINSTSSNSIHNTQMLEAAKNLLTSNERMTAYMAELQRRKRAEHRENGVTQKPKTTGKVSLSEIRMPLMWRDTDHFKNKGDHRRFAVFCLVKIGTEIYDTSLLCPVDRNLTDVSFNDVILFTNIAPDFELKLEVYATLMESDLSIASTPKKIKNTIHSSISRTVGKRLAASLKDELNNTKIPGPKFDLIATAHLTLAEASDLSHTHDLCLTPNNGITNNPNPNSKLPLFGHFCCRLAIQPDAVEQMTHCGDLEMLQKGPARSVDGFARLQNFKLELWEDEKSMESNVQPRRSIDVTRDTKVKISSKKDLDVILSNMEEGIIEDYVFRAKTSSDANKWYSALKRTIKEHFMWDHVTIGPPMPIAMPGNSKGYFLRSARQGSLYDQVPIYDSFDTAIRQSTVVGGQTIASAASQTLLRPSVHDIFAIPNSVDTSPTLSEFRSRTYSSGRSSNTSHSSSTISGGSSIGSISSSSRHHHWPFGSK